MPSDSKANATRELSHTEKVKRMNEYDIPGFLMQLEHDYGSDFVAKYFSGLFIIVEEGDIGMFRTSWNGNHTNLVRTAHAAIRGIGTMVIAPHEPQCSKKEQCYKALNIVWQDICHGLTSDGIPDGIFEGVLRKNIDNKHDQSSSQNDND